MIVRLKENLFLAAAVVLGLLFAAFLSARDFISGSYASSSVVAGASCIEPSAAQLDPSNPNKTLFVTCTGYLE